MSKPVFLWWAHKMLWKMLAKEPTLRKHEAIYRIIAKYPDKVAQRPRNDCFACQSAVKYAATLSQPAARICNYCPLVWGYSTCFIGSTVYDRWESCVNNGNYKGASRLAKKIQKLPLKKGIRRRYDIKRSPNE